MRPLSQLATNAFRVNDVVVPLIFLVTIFPYRDNDVGAIRFVNNRELVVSNGHYYHFQSAQFTLPNDGETRVPQAQLIVSQVEDTEVLERLRGFAYNKPRVRIDVALDSTPDVYEWTLNMEIQQVLTTNDVFTLVLGLEDRYNTRMIKALFDRRRAPGLF